jgi:hypothetical protein
VCVLGYAAEAMSQFPGPPLFLDPPTSPPRRRRGRSWGERGGLHWRCRLQRRDPGPVASANDVTGFLAQRTREGARLIHESRRLCGLRDIKRSDWRVGRAGSITSQGRFTRSASALRHSAFASGMAARRGETQPLTAAARSATARPGASGRRPGLGCRLARETMARSDNEENQSVALYWDFENLHAGPKASDGLGRRPRATGSRRLCSCHHRRVDATGRSGVQDE